MVAQHALGRLKALFCTHRSKITVHITPFNVQVTEFTYFKTQEQEEDTVAVTDSWNQIILSIFYLNKGFWVPKETVLFSLHRFFYIKVSENTL